MNNVKYFLGMLLVACCFSAYSQLKEFTAKGIEREIVKVNDTLCAFRCETSNLEYNTFLHIIEKSDTGLYKKCQIDSLRWLETGNNQELVRHYHRHPGFNDYPVVCLSYDAAIAYCKWLTDVYNSDKDRKYKKIVFVLPSGQEWELAATGNKKNIVYPWGTNSLRDTRKGSWQGVFLANFKRVGEGSIVGDINGNPVYKEMVIETDLDDRSFDDRSFYTSPVRSFFPNSLGIYNQSGNAAEMTIQKGLTKGGSWNSFGGEIAISDKLYFNEPSPEVGFRVFMKIIEK